MSRSSEFLQTFLLASLVSMTTASNHCKEFVTFNAGLVVTVPEPEIRRPMIIERLAGSTADIICLQEIWFEKDVAAVVRKVEDKFPHHYSMIHYQEGTLRRQPCAEGADHSPRDTACNAVEIEAFTPVMTQCAVANGCLNLDSIAQGVCIATKCAHILKEGIITETCISCLFINVGLSFEQSITACVTPKKVHNRLNSPGLLLLSRTPLKRVHYESYFPDKRMAFQRGYIEAELEDGKLVLCTHLTSIFPFSYIEYDLPFSSFEEQSKAEMGILGEKFSDKDHILTGDLNVGPVVVDSANPEKDLKGEYPDNYAILTSLGYRSPYVQQDGRCTFCSANPFTGGHTNNVIDHVMVLNTSSLTTPFVTREFDTSAPPLSDHYGVKVRVCDP